MERIAEGWTKLPKLASVWEEKDWLLLFGGSVLSLILTDIVTPRVAEHIFTMVIHGLSHLFAGGNEPPQIPPQIIT